MSISSFKVTGPRSRSRQQKTAACNFVLPRTQFHSFSLFKQYSDKRNCKHANDKSRESRCFSVQINDWLRLLKRRHSDIIQLIDIGRSYEGRRLIVIKVKARADFT